MEDLVVLSLLTLGALVLSIVALAQLGGLKASIEDLKRRLGTLEGRGEEAPGKAASPTTPPPLPAFVTSQPAVQVRVARSSALPSSPSAPFNWESILGVKLFAWIGGFALFLGVVFFVKYAFENNWITPAMRILAGAIAGLVLVAVSLLPAVRRYRIPGQSVCATGLLILYANIYAAHSFYNLIPLTAATALMWMVSAVALALATGLTTPSMAWLALFGGFVTPILFRTSYGNPAVLFGYAGVLSCAVAGVSSLKRWSYLLVMAAVGCVMMEFLWTAHFFGKPDAGSARIVYLAIQALFLAICVVQRLTKLELNSSIGASALTGFATLVFCGAKVDNHFGYGWEFVFPMLFLADVGLIAVAVAGRSNKSTSQSLALMIFAALVATWVIEVAAHFQTLHVDQPLRADAWYCALFLLFAATPYFCGVRRLWPWMVSALAGPLQFWLGYQLMEFRFPNNYEWLLPIAFGVPAAIGVFYLLKREHLDLVSADSRLATQGAAVLAFISLIFPVQFEKEWITLGWAIEGVALILLFRWIPNRRLRAVALIIFAAAFVRLALNPAVLDYHPRTRVPIWNWYLYAYGIGALCFFLGARWFGEPCDKVYERRASPMLYSFAGIVLFLLMNIEIADYFSIGPTLTFSFSGNFGRDMTYTIAWSLFALALLVFGVARKVRPLRLVAIALLCLAFAKLFLHDLNSLSQLYRIVAFISVAIIAIVASFVYQRFLAPDAKQA